jgi:16S rRNA (uracil1498-N3)-methyltransferase
MPKDRFYIKENFKKKSHVKLFDQESKHLQLVMRKKLNDRVEVVNGKGYLAQAKITYINKKETTLLIEDVFFEKENLQKIILIQAVLQPNRLDILIEKITELGVDEIWLYKSQNSIKDIQFSENRLNRIKTLLISAIKQSGRLYLPKIRIFDSLINIKKDDIKNNNKIYFGDIYKNTNRLDYLLHNNRDDIYMIIGCEKGFSEEEKNYIINSLKATGIFLNKNILRAETAAIASIAIIAHLLKL